MRSFIETKCSVTFNEISKSEISKRGIFSGETLHTCRLNSQMNFICWRTFNWGILQMQIEFANKFRSPAEVLIGNFANANWTRESIVLFGSFLRKWYVFASWICTCEMFNISWNSSGNQARGEISFLSGNILHRNFFQTL